MSAILGKWLGELTDPGVSMAGKYLFVCVCEDLPSVCILGGYVIVVFDIHTGPLEMLPMVDSALFFPAFSLEFPAVSLQFRHFPNLPLFRSFAPGNPKIIQLRVHQLSPILLFT